MTKRKKLSAILLGAFLALGVGAGIGASRVETGKADSTYTYTFTAKVFDASPQTKTLGAVDWELVTNGGYYGTDATKGQQIGSGKSPASKTNLTTSGISGTISEIKVSTSGASSVVATVGIKVGSTSLLSGGVATKSITATNTEYTFSGSASGLIDIEWNNTSAKAIYIKTITVTYVEQGGAQFGTLTSIAIKTPASKTSFEIGETFSSTGLTLTASDDSDPVITKDVTSGFTTDFDGVTFDASHLGTKTVTVDYQTKTTTYNIAVTAVAPADKFSVKGFANYTAGFDLLDHTGTLETSGTTLALRVYNGGTGAVRGNKDGIENNFSARNTTPYPGFIRKIVLNGTGGTNFTASADRSLVNVGNTPYSLDNATDGTKVQGVYASAGGVHTLTWEIPSGNDCRYFILHNLQTSGTMLAAAADAFQIYYEPAEIEFGALDHIELDTTSSDLQKTYFVGEKVNTAGLLVTAYDENDKDLVTTDYTTDPAVGYAFTQSDLGTVEITVTVTMNGVPASASYDVQVLSPRTFVKVASESKIETGKIYSMASILGSAASTSHVTGTTPFANVVDVDYDETNDSFSEVTNLQTVELVAGSEAGSFAIKLLNGENADKYYGWSSGNSLRLEETIAKTSSWNITIDEDAMRIENANDATRFISHNFTSPRFATYTSVPSNGAAAGLYEVDTGIDPDVVAVDDFVDTYMFMDAIEESDLGTGECKSEGYYADAKAAFNALTAEQRELFVSDTKYDAPRARLIAWAIANNEGLITSNNTLGIVVNPSQNALFNGLNDSNTIMLIVIISLISVSVLGGVFYLRKREQN